MPTTVNLGLDKLAPPKGVHRTAVPTIGAHAPIVRVGEQAAAGFGKPFLKLLGCRRVHH